jgi:hypothetical protein
MKRKREISVKMLKARDFSYTLISGESRVSFSAPQSWVESVRSWAPAHYIQ